MENINNNSTEEKTLGGIEKTLGGIEKTLGGIEKTETENKYDSNIVTTKKFNSNKWNMIEKPLSQADRKRNEIILKLGEEIISTQTNELTKNNIVIIGDYYYQNVKKDLKNIIEFSSGPDDKKPDDRKPDENSDMETPKNEDDTKSKKTKSSKSVKTKENKVKMNSTIKAQLSSTQKSVDKKFNVLKTLLQDNPENKTYSDLMTNLNFIEFRVICLMKLIEFYTKARKTEINKVDELVLGSKKILNLLKNIKANKSNEFDNYFKKICQIEGYDISISNDLITDLENKINGLTSKYGIKLIDIANTKPKLIYDTIYDETIPNMKLKPYDSQIELAKLVKNNVSNGFLALYKTLPGLGKTSMILAICSFIRKSNSDLKVIFCCSDLLESVRVQVLRVVFNFGIKFGIATSSPKEDSFVITNSWNCPKDIEREIIVADYKSTYLLLKESKSKYLLFFDEPTVLTDQVENTTTLNYLSLILYNLPSHTILSSATLPMLSELEPIISHFSSRFPEAKVCEIVSNKTLLGSFIKDFNSNVIIPHSYCNNYVDLKNMITRIKNFPLLGKFYTLPFLMNLNKFCLKHGCGINLDSIETFDQDNILENILNLLGSVSELDKIYLDLEKQLQVFNEFKEIQVNDIQEEQFDLERLDVEFNSVVPNKFLTSHAFKYLGCCLVATLNPVEYAKKHLFAIVDKLKEKTEIRSIHKKYESYLAEMSRYNEAVEKIKNKYTAEEKIDEEVGKLKIPKFEFNKSIEINTEPHIKSFAKYVKSYDLSMLKNSVNPEKINITEFLIDDNLKFLLYMGVGLYSKDLDPDYTNKVLEMLQDRELAYIIADESFCYGANYLISNVIIDDDIGNPHSINTILQLIGRTARIGKSWSGKVYLDVNTADRIKKFFINPTFTSIEGDNIRTFFNKIKQEINLEKELKEQKERENEAKRELKIKKEKEALENLKNNKIVDATTTRSKDLSEQTKEGGLRIIKENSPIFHVEETNSDNLSQNEIYSWKRGKTFKSGTDAILSNSNSNSEPINKSDANSNVSTNWSLKSSQNYGDNNKNALNGWVGIRGKSKSQQSELFVPKSYDVLNKNTETNFKNDKPVQPIQSSQPVQPIQSSQYNYKQFDDINFFRKSNGIKENNVKMNKEQTNNSNNMNVQNNKNISNGDKMLKK
jgi:hypothetical protein